MQAASSQSPPAGQGAALPLLSRPTRTVGCNEHCELLIGTPLMSPVIQAYRFAMDPTPRQRRALASHCGAARVAYNWGLQVVCERLEQRTVDPTVQVPWALADLRREWNRAKHRVAPWRAENSMEAYSSGLAGLARALKGWSDSRHGRPARDVRSDSQASRRRAGPGMLAGSLPARSRCYPTARTCNFPSSVSSRPMSRLASWPVAWNKGPPA